MIKHQDFITEKKTDTRVAFGRIIRVKQAELGLSQEALAEKLGLHSTYIGFIERGERNLALENSIVLAKALNCSPKDLIL